MNPDCPAPVPHDGNGIAVIRMVTGMIAHRGRRINALVDAFHAGTGRLHHEHNAARREQRAAALMAIADEINGLAQDNAYDVRKLMVYLARRRECEEETAGRTGRVCYIQ